MSENLCNKCGKCCSRIAVDFAQKVVYRDGIEPLDNDFATMLIPVDKRERITFCTCKFLKDNQCSNPLKPQSCQNFPQSAFAFLPEECGYEGIVFTKNEEIKQKIRKMKEDILDYSIKLELSQDKDEIRSLKRIIETNETFISKYNSYGAMDW